MRPTAAAIPVVHLRVADPPGRAADVRRRSRRDARTWLLAAAGAAVLQAGCGREQPEAGPDAAAGAPVAQIPADWPGRWTGPEGTYLEIEVEDSTYRLVISDLDGPRSFAGIPSGNTLAFERDGIRETLRATDGAGTGMKWLAGKSRCLTVKPGEGYCRD